MVLYLALSCSNSPSLHDMACRNTYQAWQDTEHGRQKFTRDGVETTIEKLGKNGVRCSTFFLQGWLGRMRVAKSLYHALNYSMLPATIRSPACSTRSTRASTSWTAGRMTLAAGQGPLHSGGCCGVLSHRMGQPTPPNWAWCAYCLPLDSPK